MRQQGGRGIDVVVWAMLLYIVRCGQVVLLLSGTVNDALSACDVILCRNAWSLVIDTALYRHIR